MTSSTLLDPILTKSSWQLCIKLYIKGERAANPCRQVATGLFYYDTSGGCYRFSSRMRRGVIVEARFDDRIILDVHSSAITSQSAWDLVLIWSTCYDVTHRKIFRARIVCKSEINAEWSMDLAFFPWIYEDMICVKNVDTGMLDGTRMGRTWYELHP